MLTATTSQTSLNITLTQPELRKLGLFAQHLAENAGKPTGCQALDSHINLESIPLVSGLKVIAIDAGGTNVKLAEGTVGTTGEINYCSLDNFKHSKPENLSGHSLQTFAEQLFTNLAKQYDSETLEQIGGIAIVYSNPAEIKPAEGISGVTGIVPTGFDPSLKGEWFMADVKQGDDIGKYFVEAANKAGFTGIKSVHLGNDTTYLVKVEQGCHGGVVCSTGANCTVSVNGTICNAESGRTVAPEFCLNQAEIAYTKEHKPFSLEDLAARAGMSKLLTANIVYSLDTNDNLKPLSNLAKNPSEFFTLDLMKELGKSELRIDDIRKLKGFESLNNQTIIELRNITLAIFSRAAQIGGAFCFMSVSNQEPGEKKVIYDASMSGIWDDYVRATQQSAIEIASACDSKILPQIIHRVTRDGVSLPIMGGIRALLENMSTN